MFYPNIIQSIKTTPLWSDQNYSKNFSSVIHPSSGEAFISKAEHQKAFSDPKRIALCDAYISGGSHSPGSGRSVFIERIQVKGGGRTTLGNLKEFYPDSNGLLFASEVFREFAWYKILEKLGFTMIPYAFVKVLPRKEFKSYCDGKQRGTWPMLVGRHGSPLRHAHLSLIHGHWSFASQEDRIRFWKTFISLSMRLHPSQFKRTHFTRHATEVIRAALANAVRMRFFSLLLPIWSDNCDFYGQIFDCGYSSSFYPMVSRKKWKIDWNLAPDRWFESLPIMTDRSEDVYNQAFVPVKLAISSLTRIEREIFGEKSKSFLKPKMIQEWYRLEFQHMLSTVFKTIEFSKGELERVQKNHFPLSSTVDRTESLVDIFSHRADMVTQIVKLKETLSSEQIKIRIDQAEDKLIRAWKANDLATVNAIFLTEVKK